MFVLEKKWFTLYHKLFTLCFVFLASHVSRCYIPSITERLALVMKLSSLSNAYSMPGHSETNLKFWVCWGMIPYTIGSDTIVRMPTNPTHMAKFEMK